MAVRGGNPVVPLIVNVDVRALQDDQYAMKGIGQHAAYVISILSGADGITLVPVADPMLGPVQAGWDSLFDRPPRWIDTMDGDVYLNVSPLTHDTAPFLVARRNGLKTCAVVHDFIPLRTREFRDDPERLASYSYLVQTLRKYNALVPNSLFTRQGIETVLPGYPGSIVTVHCRSRFQGAHDAVEAEHIRPATLRQLALSRPYIFVATADDPRKNPEVAIRAAVELRFMGLKLVVGGGLGEATRKRLMIEYPEQFVLAEPVFLPRLTDAELRQVYLGARLVLVGSLDEGFSLPVAEAVALGRIVVASRIPAHAEQVRDARLLFAPESARSLLDAVGHAVSLPQDEPAQGRDLYVSFDSQAERSALRALVAERAVPWQPVGQALTIVGPGPERPTGIAVYSSRMASDLASKGVAFQYVDVDAMPADEFYRWLLDHQDGDVLYIMGNNNLFHSRCFQAIQNVPGACILHDSRMFEFLLNRYGPHYILDLWHRRNGSRPITLDTVIGWQRERSLLADSFLDPIVTRASALFVHSRIAGTHIRDAYGFSRVHYLPFALQMTEQEVEFVREMRAGRPPSRGRPLLLVTLGETEPTKGNAEMVFALKMLLLQGFDARLAFVGRSDEPYHGELLEAVDRLGIAEHVEFSRYVPRQQYLDSLAAADVVVQLRYPMFGQVSGPLSDAVACGVSVVTTEDLAVGTAVEEFCAVIPNRFSPLHIAEGIRRVIESGGGGGSGSFHSMQDYTDALLRLCFAPAAA